MNGKRISAITERVASAVITAGDEWADEQTYEFAAQLAKVMSSDRSVAKATARGSRIDFVFEPMFLVSIPLVMELTEFGYGGESESVNGMITSEKDRRFRVPGGYSRSRNPKEMWKRGKENLLDIFQRAGV